jgi:hypothetical protein
VPRGGVPGASRPARQTTSLGSRITASHASSRSLGRNASSSPLLTSSSPPAGRASSPGRRAPLVERV